MRCRRPALLAAVVATAALSLLAAGCGGGKSSPGVAGVGSSPDTASTPTTQNGLLAFSRCMRSHGVPSFPDPQRYAGGNVKLTLHQYGTGSPQFRTALNACDNLLPTNGGPPETAQQTRTQVADALSFSRCMRGHGAPRFPDPTAQGQLTVEMVQGQGIDVHSTAFLRIVQGCLPASHGAITPAMVRQAIANAHG